MLQQINSDNYDFVFGTRYEKGCSSEDDTWVTYIGNFMFTLLGESFLNSKFLTSFILFVLGKLQVQKA